MSKDSIVPDIVLTFLEIGGWFRFTIGLTSECIFRINLIEYDDTIIKVAIVNVVGIVKYKALFFLVNSALIILFTLTLKPGRVH